MRNSRNRRAVPLAGTGRSLRRNRPPRRCQDLESYLPDRTVTGVNHGVLELHLLQDRSELEGTVKVPIPRRADLAAPYPSTDDVVTDRQPHEEGIGVGHCAKQCPQITTRLDHARQHQPAGSLGDGIGPHRDEVASGESDSEWVASVRGDV